MLVSERIVITSEAAAAFRSAVGNDAELYARERLVPPMAVAALVMSAAMRAVDFPAGAVHTGQELEFSMPVAENSELACTASVAQNSVRRGTRFLVLEITADVQGRRAVTGRISLAVAESEE